jgi:hypothetical protein
LPIVDLLVGIENKDNFGKTRPGLVFGWENWTGGPAISFFFLLAREPAYKKATHGNE